MTVIEKARSECSASGDGCQVERSDLGFWLLPNEDAVVVDPERRHAVATALGDALGEWLRDGDAARLRARLLAVIAELCAQRA